jgi:methyltransferase family protein
MNVEGNEPSIERPRSALEAVRSLLAAGRPIPVALLGFALAPLDPRELRHAGFFEIEGDFAHPRCRVATYAGLVVASDADATRADFVAGIDPAAEMLAHLTVRRPVERTLDVGAGCGLQALLAARHSERVVATDVRPRAQGYTILNARLNGAASVRCRESGWLEAVAGEEFDLVVGAPPPVGPLDGAPPSREGRWPREVLSRELLAAVPRRLREGGFATVLVEWRHTGDWAAPLREWVDASGCDAILLHVAASEASSASAAHGAEAVPRVASGAVVLRRRAAGKNWIEAIEMDEAPAAPAGDHLLRIVGGCDFLQSVAGDEELLDRAYTLVDGHRVEQTLRFHAGAYAAEPAVMRIAPGMGLAPRFDSRMVDILFACDGRRTLREAIEDLVARHDGSARDVAAIVASTMRRLVATGFAVPA